MSRKHRRQLRSLECVDGVDDSPALSAARAFSELCEARHWTHVRISRNELAAYGPAVGVDATSPDGRYCLVAGWHRDGPVRFGGAGFFEVDGGSISDLASLADAERFVEAHGR